MVSLPPRRRASVLSGPASAAGFLKRECEALTPLSVRALGTSLGLAANPVWELAAAHIEELMTAFRAFPETLTYNDFHWTNLAVSRSEPVRAIVFDYHLLGIGPAYCDIRNVLGSLGERARAAFVDEYGPYDDRPRAIDAPLSVLYSLTVATRLERLPGWAEGCVRCASSGELEALIESAVRTVRTLPAVPGCPESR